MTDSRNSKWLSRDCTREAAGNTAMAGALREIEHTLIPLRDGTKLAARIWLPADADAGSGSGDPRIPALPQAHRHL